MENAIIFKDLPYPIEIALRAGEIPGAMLFESAFSEAPSRVYNTILLQGEMPDPGISVELVGKSKSMFKRDDRYRQISFRRFPNGRFWAKYRVTPPTREPLKIRVINLGIKADSVLTLYDTELIMDLKDENEVRLPVPYLPDTAFYLPATIPFKVVRRQEWQAAPPKEPYIPHEVGYFTLHHTAAHYPETYEEAIAEVQFIQDYHQNARGWIDIGYHFLMDPFGNIFEGRPINVVGAHAKYRNTGNVGIAIMGNYHPPVSNAITEQTLNSFVNIGRYMKDTYSIDVSSFYAHRDISATDCPGDGLYAKKEALRDIIFNPQPVPIPVDADTSPISPAQSESLRQLLNYLKN